MKHTVINLFLGVFILLQGQAFATSKIDALFYNSYAGGDFILQESRILGAHWTQKPPKLISSSSYPADIVARINQHGKSGEYTVKYELDAKDYCKVQVKRHESLTKRSKAYIEETAGNTVYCNVDNVNGPHPEVYLGVK